MGAENKEELPQGAAAAAAAVAGRAPPAREKSSFAVTCSLLSRYLKDNKAGLQGLGGLGMAPPAAGAGAFRPPTTMNLLSALDAPAAEEPNDDAAAKATAEEAKEHDQQAGENPREEEEAQQLTIFYGGKVVIFDKFPSTKVKDLLQVVSAAGGDGATAAPKPSQNSLSELFGFC
ncbi:unnamed protein product [Urochloa decumbens]|uniref:Protein TIFY n=1 Tax=Urochloa decumbens TaxID=240449 RepID=A0ABC9FHL9_9POAL